MRQCIICEMDTDDANAKDAIIKLLEEHNCISEHVDPGGREFGFEDSRRVHVYDMCIHCDLKKLQEALA